MAKKVLSFATVEVLDSLSVVLDKGIDLAKRLKEFHEALPNASSVVERCCCLKLEEVEYERKHKELADNHKRALEAALPCAGQVADLIWFAKNKERMTGTKMGIQRGDLTPLTDFLEQLRTLYLAKAEKSCRDAECKLEEVQLSALNLATDCKKMAERGVTGKRIVVGIAGALTLIACFYSGGTVCLVVRGLTTAATVLGVYCVPSYWNDGFGELSQLFYQVKSSTDRMFDYTRAIAMYLKSISDMIDNVEGMMKTNETRSSLILAFDRLCEKCGGLNAPFHQRRLQLTDAEIQSAIKNMLQGHV